MINGYNTNRQQRPSALLILFTAFLVVLPLTEGKLRAKKKQTNMMNMTPTKKPTMRKKPAKKRHKPSSTVAQVSFGQITLRSLSKVDIASNLANG